jgi:ferrous iron transport protein A
MFIKMINITEFEQGYRVRLLDFGQTDVLYRRKLLALGLTRGVEVSVVRIAPLGCPVQVELRGTALALRKEEACHLLWEKL